MTGNISSSSKGRTGEKTVIEDVEDDVDELPDSYFSKAAARVFDKKISWEGWCPSVVKVC